MGTYCIIFSGVLIAIVNSNSSSTDANVEADLEVSWLEWHSRAVLLDHELSLQEGSLWSSRVDLLWLGDHD